MPAEIAVSIMAEIVQEKNRHFRTYCDEDVEAAIRCAVPGTMVTIIEKKGRPQEVQEARCLYSVMAGPSEVSEVEKLSLKLVSMQ